MENRIRGNDFPQIPWKTKFHNNVDELVVLLMEITLSMNFVENLKFHRLCGNFLSGRILSSITRWIHSKIEIHFLYILYIYFYFVETSLPVEFGFPSVDEFIPKLKYNCGIWFSISTWIHSKTQIQLLHFLSFYTLFENCSKCRILAFSTNFCPIKTDQSGNTVWPQASGFQKLAKMNHFWHF